MAKTVPRVFFMFLGDSGLQLTIFDIALCFLSEATEYKSSFLNSCGHMRFPLILKIGV